MSDTKKKMEALQQLATELQAGQTPELSTWQRAGFPAAKRKKDVEQAITSMKKQFSMESKERYHEEERMEAEAAGLTVEELKEQQKKKREVEHQQDKRKLDEERRAGRETKALVSSLARGDFDLKTDYVGSVGE